MGIIPFALHMLSVGSPSFYHICFISNPSFATVSRRPQLSTAFEISDNTPDHIQPPENPNPEQLDADGDVILAVEEQKFLVPSKILSLASPVFSKLLSPNFREGIELEKSKSSCPTTISLHDDDPRAMKTILAILHYKDPDHQAEGVGSPMTAERLAVLSVMTASRRSDTRLRAGLIMFELT